MLPRAAADFQDMPVSLSQTVAQHRKHRLEIAMIGRRVQAAVRRMRELPVIWRVCGRQWPQLPCDMDRPPAGGVVRSCPIKTDERDGILKTLDLMPADGFACFGAIIREIRGRDDLKTGMACGC